MLALWSFMYHLLSFKFLVYVFKPSLVIFRKTPMKLLILWDQDFNKVVDRLWHIVFAQCLPAAVAPLRLP